MAKRNVVMSVTASAVIASSLFGTHVVDAASYKVKSGDTLWEIAQKYDTNVSQLRSWNKLSSDLIFPSQVLEVGPVSGSGSSTTVKDKPKKESSSSASKASTYTVKSGDSLSKIAAAHGISVKNLMDWNKLSTTLIFPGDTFVVKKGASSGSSSGSTGSSSSAGSDSSSSASTYTVKSGDTLGQIAARHGISLNNLMKWNNLSSHLIHPGNKLVVSKGASSGSGSSSSSSNSGSNSSSSSNTTSAKTYTVKSGDTLGKIAARHGISLNNLMKWNNLSSHMIYVGDKLAVSKGAASSGSSSGSAGNGSSVSSGGLIDTAKSVIGSKYVWGGTTPSGFDCSGFIYWAFNNSGSDISRLSTDGYYNRSYMINSPKVGDLVFFENTYKSGISHMGIYLGNNEFIQAGSSTGVTISNLDNPYWSKHFHSFKRFY